MKNRFTIILTVLGLMIYGCSDDSQNTDMKLDISSAGYSNEGGLQEEVDINQQQRSDQNKPLKTEQKIIKNGSMRVESEDALKSKSSLSKKVKDLDGYFEKEEVQNDHRVISYNLVVRVPAKNFEKLIQSIESGGDMVSNKSINANDVTEEFYDIETRLSNKRAYLKRYQELLSKANTIQDILEVEEKIRVLEEEIESAEGRLRFLGNQVGYSTLRLDLFEKKAYYNEPGEDTFSDRVKRALRNGWAGIVHLAIALLTMWPFILLGGTLLFLFRRYRKRKKSKS